MYDTPVHRPSPGQPSPRARLSSMGKTPRRARGAALNMAQVNYKVPVDCKAKLEYVSNQLGVSAAEGLELILTHLELDEHGLPAWADRDRIPEALPMAQAS